jgi:tRNA A37 methylthiotransferase MiaB
MDTISFLEKKKEHIQNVVVVFPFTYVNPHNAMPPVAAEYLQAGILATGRNAILLDMRFEIDIKAHLENADLVCLYGHFEDCSIFVKHKIHVINEVLDQIPSQTPIVAGGTNFNDPEKAFNLYPKVDVIILENPETCIMELLDGEQFEAVTNIAYRKNGRLIKTKRVIHPLPEDIFPRRSARNPKYKYHAIGIPIDLVRAGIGCNYSCKFCYQYGKDFDGSFRRWQGRSAQSLFNELKEIEAPIVGWVDDDMTAGMKALDELSDMLIEHKIQKLFGGTGRIDHVNKYVAQKGVDVLKKMEKAGFLALSFGVESLNPKTLKFYGKGQSVESIEKAMRLMNKTNILLICNFIFGSPGETEKDMMDMLWFGRKWNADTIVTNRMGFPEGSEIHNAIYDPETGHFRPGMEMITGKALERIKYMVKFGQRTPLRILLSLLKLYRHRGMFLDPTYLFCCALETMTRHSWLEKTIVFPFMLKIIKKVVVIPWVRQVLRVLAIIVTPPVKLINWIFELIDKYTGLSTKLLPRFFLYLHDGMYKRQVVRSQVRTSDQS